MEYSSNDVKLLFKSVYTLVKGQDELKSTLSVDEILQSDFQLSHRLLVSQCIQLIFEDFEGVGQKSREILWRKGYYDVICVLKRQKGRTSEATLLAAADRLIREGINYFKAIVLRFVQIFNLDSLRCLIDFNLLEGYDAEALREESGCYSLLQLETVEESKNVVKELYTNQEISYALETIHSLLISLGDLHRYQLEFGIGSRVELRERTRRYYMQAFKLNPKVGMAQNQMGMLAGAQNSHLNAVYHYLYSLCCAIPFECSETNVNVIFQKKIRHLENGGGMVASVMEGEDQMVEDFIATFLLVVDVFFYDKVVTGFNNLCHSVLMDLKKILSIRQLLEDYYLTDEMLFQIVSILFFCMHRIKLINSDKIYSLNAFLVALCSELLQWCMNSFEKFANERTREDVCFQELYLQRYQCYDEQVHRARNLVKQGAAMYSKDQKSSSGVEEGTGSQDSRRGMLNKENGVGNITDKRNVAVNGSSKKAAGRAKKQSRRRRRSYSNGTDSEDDENYADEHNRHENEDEDDSDNDYFDESESDSSCEDDDEEEEDIMSLSTYGSYDEYSGEEEDGVADHGRSERENKIDQLLASEQSGSPSGNGTAPEQLKFKKRYQKLDPNIVLQFAQGERTLRSLKILFDWLLCNMDVLHNCYQTNPEFLHNIMKLLNYFNVDIFTNRFFFTRDMITVSGLRENLQEIFTARRTIPLQEDVMMKRFPLFEPTQESLLWEAQYKLAVSNEDENFLRLMKMVDFGFTVCKSKKFDYCFLPKVRAFKPRTVAGGSNRNNQMSKGQRNGKQKRKGDTAGKAAPGAKRDWNGGGGDAPNRSRGLSYSQSRNGRFGQGPAVEGFNRNTGVSNENKFRRRGHACDGEESGDMHMMVRDCKRQQRNRQRKHGQQLTKELEQEKYLTTTAPTLFTKKGYLRNRENGIFLQRKDNNYHGAGEYHGGDGMHREGNGTHERGDINALMGKLWLRNEVETLETKVNKRAVNVTLTPYLVLDSKCLTEYTSIVKNLIKTKKFVVLIPISVLGDLDELKKHSEGARNAIKWLEVEFSKGNRFLRAQKTHEMLPMPLVKIPKKLDRDGAVFSQIVQFCNYIVTNQADNDSTDIITYLSGDGLQDRKLGNGSSYTGILEAIPVKFEQIVTFYSSYKRK